MNTPVTTINKSWGITLESKWQLIMLCQKELRNQLGRKMEYLFTYLFQDQFYVKDSVWHLGDYPLEEKLYNRIEEIVLIAAGFRNFEDQALDKPQWLIDKENEIRRIKAQGQSNRNSLKDFTKLILPLIYEYNYTTEQIFEMNYFHVKFLAKQINAIVRYDIQKRQVFSKQKIKYITDD